MWVLIGTALVRVVAYSGGSPLPAGITAGLLLGACALLVAAYPATAGPAFYSANRGWISPGSWYALYMPLLDALPEPSKAGFQAYLRWWRGLALEHLDAATD